MSEKITLLVHGAFYRGDAITRRMITAEKKENLLTVLKRSGLYLRDCNGNGTCGKCMVRFLKGAPLPTQSERVLLSADRLRAGVRLACRHTADMPAELALEMELPAIPTAVGADDGAADLQTAPAKMREGGAARGKRPDEESGAPFFIAADIGTTTVVMRGVCGKKQMGAYSALNPQRVYGADVISRISAGMRGHAAEMQRQILRCLEEGVNLIRGECAGSPEYMVIAANTTMVHLLCGDSVEPLSAYPFEPVNIRPQQIVVAGIPAYIICGFSAFVGGDIVAGMTSLGLHNSDDLQLFIDLGTNGEIVLGKKGRFLCTAAPAGPAFEGNISAGLMGADLIQIAAELLDEGLMDEHGLLKEPYFGDGIDRSGTHIRQEDIRELQKAKAAVAAGIELLLEAYGACPDDVRHIFLAGGFGYHLNPEAALRIGLMPGEFAGRISAVGNAALQGACLLGDGDMRDWEARTMHLTDDCTSQNLAAMEQFEAKYIAHLDFPA